MHTQQQKNKSEITTDHMDFSITTTCLLLFGFSSSTLSKELCCISFTSTPIKHVVGYHKTYEDCPVNGFIFITKQQTVCAHPEESWVQNLMRDLGSPVTEMPVPNSNSEADTEPKSDHFCIHPGQE
ncbi:C-C motif chemokine 3-like [Triplophysa dalaica]|uniref:C-C motif chemokine 3-like n=1 Tax=Triplophysa dalaica TaxID=1582913 RepID=UPI0024E03E76|nr:C-C motif chemokine 3-like [Triplophysa dalaica]